MPWRNFANSRPSCRNRCARSPAWSAAESAGQIAVVDRPGWIRANVDGFRVVLDPLAQQLREKPGAWPAAGGLLGSVGSRFTGVQMGLILAFLAGRVLGQYELFLPPDPAGGGPEGTARQWRGARQTERLRAGRRRSDSAAA